ncbi:6184_t:CDS:1, partial [Ambispora gerdemannii]
MTIAYNNEQGERCRWWEVTQQLEREMQKCINTLLLEKLAFNFKFW